MYLDNGGWAGVMGRINNVGDGYGCVPKGYYLRLAADGTCSLVAIDGKAGPVDLGDKEHQEALRLASNTAEKGEKQVVAGMVKDFSTNQWHNVKLQFSGATITGFVDGAQVFTTTNQFSSHGMAGVVTGDNKARNTACFDNLLINAVGAATPKATVFAKDQTPIYKR